MKNKDIYHYRKMLHKDSVSLLVTSILFAILGLLFEAYPLFFISILFIIFLIIMVCNKKENKPFVGILPIFIGGLMMLSSIGDGSLFGIVYFILGLFYIIHAILYLIKYKNSKELIQQQKNEKKSNFPYLNLALIILSIASFYPLVSADLSVIFLAIVVSTSLIVFVSSIILMVKKYKGALLYITFVISMIVLIIFGAILFEIMGIINL